MNVMVVGGGGREHAIIKKIKENKTIKKIYALPGNGGISEYAVCIDIDAKNIDEIAKFAQNNNIDYAIISPDDPLVLGAVDKLESIYLTKTSTDNNILQNLTFKPKINIKSKTRSSNPKVLIPVFPGTNCEYDSAKVISDAGGETNILVINNLSSKDIEMSIERFEKELKNSHIIFIPGGFSGGDEPDGSAKFITAFFRNEIIKKEVNNFLENKGGLILGICNGFQALIKLGLVPFGKIVDVDKNCPTLTFNKIGKHQSRIIRTRICSNNSPWLSMTNVGEIYSVPISHGEGRFIASNSIMESLKDNGQIATQYVDLDGNATMDVKFNPNNSMCAIEGITSPDGRVFGKMGHVERKGYGLYKNVLGNYDMKIFESAINYFK